MNKKKGMSLEWVLLPILFASAAVLAGSDMGSYASDDPCMSCPTVVPNTPLPDASLMDEPPMSGDYVRRGGVVASTQVRQTATAEVRQSASVQAQALGQESSGFLDDAESVSSGNMNYVGGNTRLGIGIDTEFKGRADLSHVFSETEDSMTSGQGWIGVNPKASKDKNEETLTGMGLKLNHHWVATDEGGQPDYVNKVFGAYDQNVAKDKKVTVGYGQERENMFWSGHASKGLSDKRVSGTTADGKNIYEKAYDMGVGGRVGTFMDDQLMRVQGGLDYEWGTEKADSEKRAAQLTVSGGVEKFFADSPHSVGANIEVMNEQGGYAGDEHKTDVRGNVNYRYDFGGEGVFAADQKYRRVRVEIPGKTVVTKKAPKVERKLVKHTMELEADTFFEVGKYQLTGEAQQSLRTIIARIRESGHEGNIRITGNTCDAGSTQANQLLSERRAASVRNFLAANGFNAGELLAQGYGELRPKYPNIDSTRHKNRRVDIEYVSYETKYQDQVVQNGGEVRTQTPSSVVWRKELIPTPPSWVGQALHNNIQYKQTIDTYRTLGADAAAPVGNTNSSPVANNDTQTTTTGTSVVINVLQNDTDADGDTPSVESFTQPAHGTVKLVDGMLVYTPADGYTGADSFTYIIIDGRGGTATGTVYVTVGAAANINPVAVNDTVGTKQDIAVTISVLGNDTDANGDILSIAGADKNSVKGGSVSVVNGSIVYTPAKGYTGTDTFNYTISDGRGGTATAMVTVQVAAVSMVPANDSYKIAPGDLNANGRIQLNILANDVYKGVAQGIRIITHPSQGSITNVDGAGNITAADSFVMYQPKAGVVGTDSFVYVLVDANGNLSPQAIVTIELSGSVASGMSIVDDGADGKDSNYNFSYGDFSNPVTPRDLPVLSNDTGTGLTIIAVSKPRFGSAAISSDGQSIIYTPRDGYCESHTLTYTVRDKDGNEGTATVYINIH